MLLLTARPGCGGSFFPIWLWQAHKKHFMWKFLAQVCGKLKPGDLVLSARAQAWPLPATHRYSGSTGWGGVEHGGSRGRGMLLPRLYM